MTADPVLKILITGKIRSNPEIIKSVDGGRVYCAEAETLVELEEKLNRALKETYMLEPQSISITYHPYMVRGCILFKEVK